VESHLLLYVVELK